MFFRGRVAARSRFDWRFTQNCGVVPSACDNSQAVSGVIPRFPPDQLVYTLHGYANMPCECNLGDSQGFKEFFEKYFAWVSWRSILG